MLQGLLARYLASKLGKFVDGLDQENLNVALWRGEILLENLRIKSVKSACTFVGGAMGRLV